MFHVCASLNLGAVQGARRAVVPTHNQAGADSFAAKPPVCGERLRGLLPQTAALR